MTLRVLASLLFTLAGVVGLPTAAHGRERGGAVRISTEPGLFPDFAPGVRNYVTRCGADGRVRVAVAASRRVRVSVDGEPARTGSFSATVSVTAGQGFHVRVADPRRRVMRYFMRCLPLDFPAFTAKRSTRPQAQWYIVAPFFPTSFGPAPAGTSLKYVGIFDTNGVPVWWYRAATQALDAKLLSNGNIAWLQFNPGGLGEGSAEEHRLDGSTVRTLSTAGSGTDSHEIQLLRNGNYLLARYYIRSGVDLTGCGGPPDGSIEDNELQEVSPGGSVVWSWNASHHIPVSEVTQRWKFECSDHRPADVYHFNSAEADGRGLVLSFRHLDAVVRINRHTGAIDWKLGGTPRPESLRPIRDPELAAGGFAGQHDARVLRDGTLTVHDNGTFASRPPRAVRYRIDRRAKTATLLEDVRDAAAPTSICCGSARRLAGGNWVTAWGSQPFVSELTPAGNPVFRLTFTQNLFSYRAEPLPFGRLSAATLRRAMESRYPRSRAHAAG